MHEAEHSLIEMSKVTDMESTLTYLLQILDSEQYNPKVFKGYLNNLLF